MCDGSQAEWDRLTDLLVDGTFTRLNPKLRPNSFWSGPTPVTWPGWRTGRSSAPSGKPTPGRRTTGSRQIEMRQTFAEIFAGCVGQADHVRGAVLHGPAGQQHLQLGVEITDSAVRGGLDADHDPIGAAGGAGRDRGVPGRSSGACTRWLRTGRANVPWPCNKTKYIRTSQTREIWSYGSGYGGNALLGGRSATHCGSPGDHTDEGWLAEHMLILKLTPPGGEPKYITAAFPSACGKTNLAMLAPTIPSWKVEAIGDDIAWMRFGPDGRLHAINPEAGFFGVAHRRRHRGL